MDRMDSICRLGDFCLHSCCELNRRFSIVRMLWSMLEGLRQFVGDGHAERPDMPN